MLLWTLYEFALPYTEAKRVQVWTSWAIGCLLAMYALETVCPLLTHAPLLHKEVKLRGCHCPPHISLQQQLITAQKIYLPNLNV